MLIIFINILIKEEDYIKSFLGITKKNQIKEKVNSTLPRQYCISISTSYTLLGVTVTLDSKNLMIFLWPLRVFCNVNKCETN